MPSRSDDLEESCGERGSSPVRVHEPVLLAEALEILDLAPGLTVVDGTVGAGGHGGAIAAAIAPTGLLVGMDRDAEILTRARESLEGFSGSRGRVRIRLFHLVFSKMRAALEGVGRSHCDRVLLDLGVSSWQLDAPERGFSFMQDAKLDMRMDCSAPLTAADWLRRVPERELARVLLEYGGERNARRIAGRIVAARGRGAMQTTADLVAAVGRPRSGARRARIHPATRTFQAIRIAVNDELGELERGLAAAQECLRPGGRLAVISFHSAEDRLVKQHLRAHTSLLTRKPITASAAEVQRNPRARSAKLRAGVAR